MVERAFFWFWNRYRPAEGWLAFWLLVGAVSCLVAAVLAVNWVPEDNVVLVAGLMGLLFGIVLAKRPLSSRAAWAFIILYGLLVPWLWLGHFWPSFARLAAGWEPTRQFWLQQGGLLLDRIGGWVRAATSGGRSEETIVFALGLGWGVWFLAAFAGWQTFRRRRPIPVVGGLGLALALNVYFGGAGLGWAAIFVAVMAALTAVLNYADLEHQWRVHQVDFSPEIRLDLVLAATGIALTLLAAAFLLPAIRLSAIAHAFASQPAVEQAEERLEEVFAGVNSRRLDPAVAASGGVLPRSYLLGNAPELSETIVMLASVTTRNDTGDFVPASPDLLRGAHWRGLTYDIYTGRGWAVSEERQERLPAQTAVSLPPLAAQVTFRQQIEWVYDQRVTRYALGTPILFDHDVVLFWRGLTDFSRAQGEPTTYEVVSRLPRPTPAALRETAVSDVPPAILARYTALPPTVPQRVHNLAQEVAGSLPTAYDQARALERFLRQYPYSLAVPLPPAAADPVDFFLFELQKGYCDYYASAMVVMARSLGLPARLAVGFLAQPPDENGRQIVYQINGHSWAEVYFAGYGWVAFEPTAPFASPHETDLEATDLANLEAEFGLLEESLPPLPPPPEKRPFFTRAMWAWLFLIGLGVGLGGWTWWRKRQQRNQPAIVRVYERLLVYARRLSLPTSPHLTPTELAAIWLASLEKWAQTPWLKARVHQIRPGIETLVEQFTYYQYSQHKTGQTAVIRQTWQTIRRPLWLLWLARKLLK
ncbi:MAG: hypothetical protein D6706_13950 [Chloroflexi bacterium]|nr:MAG: hypothetical protein D6706_13950 [Chloroflexota bacterium]